MENNNNKAIFRSKVVPFTQVSNVALDDEKLSLKAQGLYAKIQRYITIPNFVLNVEYLMSKCSDKETSFENGWKELKRNGYLKQYRISYTQETIENGEVKRRNKFRYEYELLDTPDLDTPYMTNVGVNGNITSTKSIKVEPKEEEQEVKNAYPPKSTLCKTHPIQNGGDIINTDSSNTYSYSKNISKDIQKEPPMDLTFIDDVIDKVKLTKGEYDKLVKKFGTDVVHTKIRQLDNYISNGKGEKYKHHHKVINTWCNTDIKQKEENTKNKPQPKGNNGRQQTKASMPDYDFDSLEEQFTGIKK